MAGNVSLLLPQRRLALPHWTSSPCKATETMRGTGRLLSLSLAPLSWWDPGKQAILALQEGAERCKTLTANNRLCGRRDWGGTKIAEVCKWRVTEGLGVWSCSPGKREAEKFPAQFSSFSLTSWLSQAGDSASLDLSPLSVRQGWQKTPLSSHAPSLPHRGLR